MLIFGHAGIALGAAALAARAVRRHRAGWPLREPFFAPLLGYMDARIFIIGSLLPDIIDKPVGDYFFRSSFYNGRIFAHTLLFFLIIGAAGYYVYRRHRRIWPAALAGGVFTHLVLDEMWQAPGTVFWPLLGWQFTRNELKGWFAELMRGLLDEPYVFVFEVVGLGVAIWFGAWLLSRQKLVAFIRRGKID